MNDGIIILIIFAGIILIPIIVVFLVFAINKSRRKRKNIAYTGMIQGKVLKIVNKGLDSPWVIYVHYTVNGVSYEIKETAKLKSQVIKIGFLPIGQKKNFVLGPIKEGDLLPICYDEDNPQKAIIYGNDGVITS